MCIAYFLGRVSPLWLLEFGRMFFWITATCPSAIASFSATWCKLDLPGCLVCHRGPSGTALDVHWQAVWRYFTQAIGIRSPFGNCWHRTVMELRIQNVLNVYLSSGFFGSLRTPLLMSTYTSSRSSWHNSWYEVRSLVAEVPAQPLQPGVSLNLSILSTVMYTQREPPSTGNLTSLTSLRSYTFNASGWDAIRWCSSQGKRHKSRSAEKCGHAVRSSWDCRWNQMFFSNCPFLFWGPVRRLSLWPSDSGYFLSI